MGGKGLFYLTVLITIHDCGESGQELKVGAGRQGEKKQREGMQLIGWPIQVSYTLWDHVPGDDTTHSGLNPPQAIINQENTYRLP